MSKAPNVILEPKTPPSGDDKSPIPQHKVLGDAASIRAITDDLVKVLLSLKSLEESFGSDSSVIAIANGDVQQ